MSRDRERSDPLGPSDRTLTDSSSDPLGAVRDVDERARQAAYGALDVERTRAAVTAGLFPERAEPVKAGRFVVLSRIGGGAMGNVFAAYDPELDRRVALKLIRPGGTEDASERRRERLVREAKAMAKLSHPNVIPVFDVGTLGDEVFIAMELVDGLTIRKWVRAEHRPWHAVLDVFSQAGHGLAAAHAVGLVHRDFKPENVLVGNDGRVRVVDFGLAHEPDTRPEHIAVAALSQDTTEDSRLTRTGMVLGTPAYMAPEQMFEANSDERSDQFSFAVAFYEALYGTRPFAGDNLAALGSNIAKGLVRPPPADARVPVWLRAVVVRALAANPQERFADMNAMLVALARDPRARRGRWLVGGAGLLGATAIAVALWPGPSPICRGAERKIARVWNPTRKQGLDRAFRATHVPYADDARREVEARLDAYAQHWGTEHTRACEAHRGGDQPAELLDRRIGCLTRRLHELDALIGVLMQPDEAVVEYSVEATSALGRLEVCSDPAYLDASVRPPEDPRTERAVEDVHSQLEHAGALAAAGKFPEAFASSEPLVERVAALEYPPVEAEVNLAVGTYAMRVGQHDRARELLEQAFWTARRGVHGTVAAESAVQLVAVGMFRADFQGALRWVEHADAATEAIGNDPELRTYLSLNAAKVLGRIGRGEDALARARAALSIATGTFGAEHPTTASAHESVGVELERAGEFPEGLEHHRRALEIRRTIVGDHHPYTGSSHHNVGTLLARQGQYADGLEHLLEAIRILEQALGADHIRVAASATNTGNVYELMGQPELAIDHFERAITIREQALGRDHPAIAVSVDNLGRVLMKLGRFEESEVALERGKKLREDRLGSAHPELALSLQNLGELSLRRGDVRGAEALFVRTLEIREAALGPGHPYVAETLTSLGAAVVARDPKRAIVWLERALAIFERRAADPVMGAKTRATLAEALWTRGHQRERALELARDAAATLREASGAAEGELERIERWIAERTG